jgi:hypothetical protein
MPESITQCKIEMSFCQVICSVLLPAVCVCLSLSPKAPSIDLEPDTRHSQKLAMCRALMEQVPPLSTRERLKTFAEHCLNMSVIQCNGTRAGR